ncbi:hypothetical protein ES708_13601 [subsurface metagenome]
MNINAKSIVPSNGLIYLVTSRICLITEVLANFLCSLFKNTISPSFNSLSGSIPSGNENLASIGNILLSGGIKIAKSTIPEPEILYCSFHNFSGKLLKINLIIPSPTFPFTEGFIISIL